MKNLNIREPNGQDKSQRQIENTKSKRHTKNALQRFTKNEDLDEEEIYENFEKFSNKHK
jgi:hypothetical protein